MKTFEIESEDVFKRHQAAGAVLTSSLAQAARTIPCNPLLNDITGSLQASVVLQQMLYWGMKAGNKPFYKFLSPCDHEAYKKGDSWAEELNLSHDQARYIITKLCCKLTKKVTRRENPHALCYSWSKNNKTFYELNYGYLNVLMSVLHSEKYERGTICPNTIVKCCAASSKDRDVNLHIGNVDLHIGDANLHPLYIQENTQESTTGDLLPTDSPLPTVESSLQLEEKLKRDFDFSLNHKSTYDDHYEVAEKVIKLLKDLPYTRRLTIADTLCLTYTDELSIMDRESLTKDLEYFDRLPRIFTEMLAILRIRLGGVLSGAYLLKRYLTGFKQLDDGVTDECMHYTYLEADLMMGRFHRRDNISVHKNFQVDAIKALHQANSYSPVGFGMLVDALLEAHPDKTNTAYLLNVDVVHAVAVNLANA